MCSNADARLRLPGGGVRAVRQVNEAARNIMCQVCRNTFLCTTREAALLDHAVRVYVIPCLWTCWEVYVCVCVRASLG
jgi:hypothetical protein